jgi:hypothetical protein
MGRTLHHSSSRDQRRQSNTTGESSRAKDAALFSPRLFGAWGLGGISHLRSINVKGSAVFVTEVKWEGYARPKLSSPSTQRGHFKRVLEHVHTFLDPEPPRP